MKTFSLMIVSLLAAASLSAAPIQLEVSLDGRQLDVRDELGRALATYEISPGVKKHPTPKGSFSIRRLIWNPSWVPPNEGWARGKKARGPADPKNPMKVVKIFFKEPDYYIHGTDQEHLLGEPASHGCIRVSTYDAYDLAKMLMQNGGTPKSEDWYRRTLNGTKTMTVRLRTPIPIKISS